MKVDYILALAALAIGGDAAGTPTEPITTLAKVRRDTSPSPTLADGHNVSNTHTHIHQAKLCRSRLINSGRSSSAA